MRILGLALGCAVILAPAAMAGHNAARKHLPALKMLPNVGCQGLLTNADFPGTVTESTLAGGAFSSVEEGRSGSSGFFTSCQFNPPEPTELDPTPSKNVGVDELGVEPRAEFETRGHRHNLLLAFPSIPESSRYQLHGVGTRAYFLIDNDGGAIGYLQVRNDIFIVGKEEVPGIKEMLATVASELCKSCNEAELPQPKKSH
ncbi:MAG: hypothetical protein WB507_11845 [Solirubrobacterales bacterium]